jgi:hypothetical protein
LKLNDKTENIFFHVHFFSKGFSITPFLFLYYHGGYAAMQGDG